MVPASTMTPPARMVRRLPTNRTGVCGVAPWLGWRPNRRGRAVGRVRTGQPPPISHRFRVGVAPMFPSR
jgi:hypothetical protein